MALLIAHITVGQAATVINIIIAFLQYTLGLAIVALLIWSIPAVNSALAWNVIGRRLHTSLWPTLLRTDTLRGSGFRVAFFSYLSLVTTVLVAVAGIIMPLGLSTGPDLHAPLKTARASFIADTSPLGLATSPRQNYVYGRVCGANGPMTCPGGGVNTTVIAADTVSRFNATPYGPFGMQFRRYYNGTAGFHWPMLVPTFATTESLILRNGIFAVGGLIVDLDNPGIGLWNHTLPTGTERGATWSEDVLWLEPVSQCVDTNLTVDYTLQNSPVTTNQVNNYNLVDHGGFYNLTTEYPTLNRDGQNLDLQQHAYKGAVLSNFYTMFNLGNITRKQSYSGRLFPINFTQTNFFGGQTQTINMLYMGAVTTDNVTITGGDLATSCEGYGGLDSANISNVAVHCSMFLGPPQRTDGGDPTLPADNSTWTQRMFSCASGTRARMQRVDFNFNGTMDMSALAISRRNIDTPVLWATEATDLNLTNVDLLWGRVPDSLEGDPNLQTIRSDVFYVPAGGADIWGVTTGGQPTVLPALAWSTIGNLLGNTMIVDYSGISNYALLRKFQQLILSDPTNGAAQIQKLIWTDIMANNMVGTDSRTTLLIGENVSAIAYDLRYAIPALLLFLLWLPTFGGAVFVLVTGLLRLSYLKFLLTHTSSGRIALGDSALRPMHHGPGFDPGYMTPTTPMAGTARNEDETRWAKGAGRTPVGVEQVGSNPPEYKGDFMAVATHPSSP
ncbi:hypothetical protein MVEN_02588900 [Mycena venus]|uniref:Uncharacterized protein n=1 Tax=Mycena venus TaxID=2733690 RepID=A0A8H6TZG5_9AGAR|nr:hypothetical protein MVEN_02588900 [Mycena venus]